MWHLLWFTASLLWKTPSPFSRASICSWVKDVLFLCSFRFSWSRIWASSESSPLELMELVFSPPPSCCWQPSGTKRIGQYEKFGITWDLQRGSGIATNSKGCIFRQSYENIPKGCFFLIKGILDIHYLTFFFFLFFIKMSPTIQYRYLKSNISLNDKISAKVPN